jgi:hypothetical protein
MFIPGKPPHRLLHGCAPPFSAPDSPPLPFLITTAAVTGCGLYAEKTRAGYCSMLFVRGLADSRQSRHEVFPSASFWEILIGKYLLKRKTTRNRKKKTITRIKQQQDTLYSQQTREN